MRGTDYRTLVQEQAAKSGKDPAEALREFIDLVRQIDDQRELGQLCQERKQELSKHYDYHLKHIPLPDGVEPIPMPRLSKKYGVWKNRQKKANQSVAVLTRMANAILGGTYLKTPNRSRPQGGGEDA
jgi:hypothetical protein